MGSTQPIQIGASMDLSFAGFFERSTVREFINFHSRLVVSRTPKEERMEVALEKGIAYTYVTSDRIGISVIADEEYPKRVAFDLIYKIMQKLNEFVFTNKINLETITTDYDIKFKYLDTLVAEWQNPKDKDNIMKLQGEIDDVTKIMKKNLSDLLQREENLEQLMSKSNDLSKVSVEFYKKAKATNKKCCSLS
eukprot:CAMPEP_0170522658 /NCGR_PEP_ID=MMETSP0209-20121228/8080_1 /TAXON_ID=665100 ORGANISM="Litonotus pictus, Strain P1" /NCGR_SAMPLE_ID=MMETSP0209 /ASSEMBLY_ACC=CAM_ASM_000301 /LENGTH=192 /DNA_ID=CAMNT_0010810291 /DNA_START=46 /DNA_END=624 /DNA_ORIENTATION=+